MRIAYFDCFSGMAGDMTLAALVDAGLPLNTLSELISTLKLPGVTLNATKVKRHGISATHVDVKVDPEQSKKHRHLHHIVKIIEEAGLSRTVTQRALAVFTRLAEAEAAVHDTTVEKVHFHEVGAADAIVDIVGACVGFEALRIDRFEASPVPTGHGTVTCEHGVMPVPAPATTRLLRGIPLTACDEPGELITPTGAAILTTLATRFGPLPAMKLTAVGVGAGTREGKTRPNIMRLLIGEAAGAENECSDSVAVLEAQVDDATGQTIAFALEQILSAGALDAYIVPITMKKGRPGQLLTVLVRPADADAIERILLSETTTFGVRRTQATRTKLARRHISVQTAYGSIRIKVGELPDLPPKGWPEYEDCAAAARTHGVPLRTVQAAALQAWDGRSDVGP